MKSLDARLCGVNMNIKTFVVWLLLPAVTAGAVATTMTYWPGEATQAAPLVRPLDPSPLTPQQRIDDAFDALRQHN